MENAADSESVDQSSTWETITNADAPNRLQLDVSAFDQSPSPLDLRKLRLSGLKRQGSSNADREFPEEAFIRRSELHDSSDKSGGRLAGRDSDDENIRSLQSPSLPHRGAPIIPLSYITPRDPTRAVYLLPVPSYSADSLRYPANYAGMESVDVSELVDRLGSREDAVRKMAVFKLQSNIGDPSFAELFIHEGGLRRLKHLTMTATGNTLAYSLTSFSRLLEVDKGWDLADQELVERVSGLLCLRNRLTGHRLWSLW